jgi:hypothetical protein
MRWHPSKEKIQYWVKSKESEFSLQDIQGLRVNAKQWKDKYIYSDMCEIFFAEFPCLLHEWIKMKDASNSSVWPLDMVVWDQDKLEEFKGLDNKWTWAIEFYFS